MKKPEFSLKTYAIVAGFILISVLQIIHAIMGLSGDKTFSKTGQTMKMKNTIEKSRFLIPTTTDHLTGEH